MPFWSWKKKAPNHAGKRVSMKNWNWKAIALGVDILLLIILALGLARSVVHQS